MMTRQYTTKYTVWHLPKLGDPEQFYEDRYCPLFSHTWKKQNGTKRFAIADGVSRGYESGRWAACLTSAYVQKNESCLDVSFLEELAASWKKEELTYLERHYPDPNTGHRMLREKKIRDTGASSTLHGLELLLDEGRWNSICIGDSCLFHLRDSRILTQNPEMTAEMFGNTPSQISTLCPHPKCWETTRKIGTFQEGDIFILATDSLSHWILKDASSSLEKIQTLLSIKTQEEFEEYINRERLERRMNDDDITLAVIHIGKPLPSLRCKCGSCRQFDCPHRQNNTL